MLMVVLELLVMMFNTKNIDSLELEKYQTKINLFVSTLNHITDEIVEGKGRYYHISKDKSYPSVTTVLGKMSDKSWLEDWRNRVGYEEAARITNESCIRGTSMHLLCEKYLDNELDLNWAKNELGYPLFKSLELIHLKKITPLAQEIPLWSDKLKVAGRTDCIGYYDGVLSIIDFKTSRRDKSSSMIEDYFLQSTLYSIMLYEQTGIMCKQIVILIGVDSSYPLVFKRDTKDYVKKCIDLMRQYYEN